MTPATSGFSARHVRFLAVATAIVFAGTACKPAAHDHSVTLPTSAKDSGATATRIATTSSAAVNNALHELDDQSRTTVLTNTGSCTMEKLNDAGLVPDKVIPLATPSNAVFIGWVGEKTTKRWPLQPSLRFDRVAGGRAWEVGLGTPVSRKDVAKHFNAPSMEMTGFKVPVDLSSLPTGDYAVRVVYDSAAQRMSCDRHIRIRIGS